MVEGIVKRYNLIILFLIIFLAAFLRLYQLTGIPPSLSWDETAVGYNAWTITHYGKDEWGKTFPLVFRSFGDDKHPVHIYITALFVVVLGPTEYAVRLPSAILGILNVLLMFWLGKLLFKKDIAGYFAALSLAISPWAIHFSRFNHELNFALFFFILGFCLFIVGMQRKNIYLSLSFLSWGISLLTYHSSKVVVPPVISILIAINITRLLEAKKYFLTGLIILFLFFGLIFTNPGLLGTARVKQTSFSKDQMEATKAYKITNQYVFGLAEITFDQYLKHFTPEYLFRKGDQNPRLGVHSFGQFYYLDLFFALLGILYLLKVRSRLTLALLVWLTFAPIPSALVNEAPQSGRAMFMVGSLHLLIAAGFLFFTNLFAEQRSFALFKKVRLKFVAISLVVIIYLGLLSVYAYNYYRNYNDNAIEWQYGMKQIVSFIKLHPEYNDIYISKVRAQPYIFFLYHLPYPLPKYLEYVEYNKEESYTYNLVAAFDKYNFEWFDPVKISYPDPGKLYILTPSEYDGLVHKVRYKVKERVLYPNNTVAFYLVSIH